MNSREQFERWMSGYCKKMGFNFHPERLINGEYCFVETHSAYLGWQASRESLAANLPLELEFDLRGDKIVNSASNSYASGYNDALREVDKLLTQYD